MATCSVCGNEYPRARAELGYDYCLEKACRDKAGKSMTFMEVGYNKSAGEFRIATTDAFQELKHTGRRGR